MLLMSDITKITIIFAAILAVLMVVLIIVTVKVLKSGKDTEEEDKEDVQDTVQKALSDDEYEEQDDDEDEDEEPEVNEAGTADAEAEVEEPAEEAEGDYEDSDEDEDPNNDPTDDISEIQAKLHKVAPEYTTEETVVMDDMVDEVNEREALIDSEFADSAFAPQSVADKLAATVAKADLEKKAEYEARKAKLRAAKAAAEGSVVKSAAPAPAIEDVILPKAVTEEDDVLTAATQRVEIDEEAVAEAPASAAEAVAPAGETEASYEAEVPAEEDSAFGDSAFGDSAFEDSAFGEQPEAAEEHIHPLPETSQTIPVNPVNAVNIATVNSVDMINTTNESAGISDMNQVKDFLEENPVPKKKKRKIKKKEQEFIKKFGDLEPHFKNGSYYWYNNQDIENLTKKEDMYFYCHYFNNAADAVMPLIVEMYDCAFVRTEEIQYIAYGVRFKSMNFRQIINTKEHIEFDMADATKQPNENDKMLIFDKWCGYVDKFMEIIVFNAPEEVRNEIIEMMYEYGRNDVDVLMNSPE